MQQLNDQNLSRRRVCPLCGTPGHYSKTCTLFTGAKLPNRSRHCGICGEVGHDRRKCEWTLLNEAEIAQASLAALVENDNTDVGRSDPSNAVTETAEPLDPMLDVSDDLAGISAGESFMTCESFQSCAATPGPTSLNSWDSSTESEVLQSQRRTVFRVATLNVNTLMKVGQRHLLLKDMERLDIDVLCIQETRLRETGTHKLGDNGSFWMFLQSADQRGYSGVGVIVRSHLQVFHSENCNERLMIVGLRHMNRELIILSCYAPTNTDNDDQRDEFWAILESKLMDLKDKFPLADLIVAGDYNAEIGCDMQGVSNRFGPHLDAERTTDNGHGLLEICTSQNLYIQNGRNRSPPHRRFTFRGFSGDRRATLDYILVSKALHDKWIRSKVRTTLVDTDHRCFIVEMDLGKIPRRKNKQRRPKLYDSLHGDLKRNFNHRVKELIAQGGTSASQHEFQLLQQAIKDAMFEVNMSPYRPKTEWITNETMLLCHARRQSNSFGIQGPALVELNRMCRQAIRRDKREWLLQISGNIRKAAAFNIMRDVYENIYRLAGKKKSVGYVGDPALLAEHFRSLGGEALPIGSIRRFGTAATVESISVVEIRKQLSSFRRGKMPGPDGIPTELWASLDDDNLSYLSGIMTRWLRLESEIPAALREAEVIPLHKKGAHHDPRSFRGISLLQAAFKLYEKVIAARLEDQLEHLYSESQSGFRKHRSTMDNIFSIHRLCEAAYAHCIPVTIVLLDFNAAFDSLNLNACWELFREAGINCDLIDALRHLYKYINCRTDGVEFQRTRGVPQGSVLGPKIFTSALQLALGQHNYPDIWK